MYYSHVHTISSHVKHRLFVQLQDCFFEQILSLFSSEICLKKGHESNLEYIINTQTSNVE